MRRVIRWGAMATLPATTVCLVCYFYFCHKEYASAFECPDIIAVPEGTIGEVSHLQFQIRNDTLSPVQVTDMKASCSCSKIEIVIGSKLVSETQFTIPCDSQATVKLTITIDGWPGSRQNGTISFQTSCLNRPAHQVEWQIQRLISPIQLSPRSVTFGNCEPGSSHIQRIVIYGDREKHLKMLSATSSAPDRFRIRPVEPIVSEIEASPIDRIPFAAFEVKLLSEISGPKSGNLKIDIGGDLERSLVVPVSGTVKSSVERLTSLAVYDFCVDAVQVIPVKITNMHLCELAVLQKPTDVVVTIAKTDNNEFAITIGQAGSLQPNVGAAGSEIHISIPSSDEILERFTIPLYRRAIP